MVTLMYAKKYIMYINVYILKREILCPNVVWVYAQMCSVSPVNTPKIVAPN